MQTCWSLHALHWTRASLSVSPKQHRETLECAFLIYWQIWWASVRLPKPQNSKITEMNNEYTYRIANRHNMNNRCTVDFGRWSSSYAVVIYRRLTIFLSFLSNCAILLQSPPRLFSFTQVILLQWPWKIVYWLLPWRFLSVRSDDVRIIGFQWVLAFPFSWCCVAIILFCIA